MDDEFAKDVSEFDTLDELKADTKKNLEQRAADSSKVANDNNVITKIVNEAKIDIPEVLIKREIDFLGRNYEQQFRQQGFVGKEYDSIIENFVNQYKEGARNQAEFNVKAELVLEAIIKKEGIKASEEDIAKEIDEVAKSYNVEEERLEAFKESLLQSSRSYVEENLQKRKAIEMLVNSAVFVEPKEEENKSVEE
ncbi:MAG TPA: hypothetical protein DEF04_07890 [Clostridiales bacterium]|nr:hypothetical protein [Clostridiales bacterium]